LFPSSVLTMMESEPNSIRVPATVVVLVTVKSAAKPEIESAAVPKIKERHREGVFMNN
ncbi:MAG: hypothetical protein JWO94_1235, partial [Verrucomicrobiaceae bacterium]|nr:hypothetical protein [Verrucomicrobiaceae bacterium]